MMTQRYPPPQLTAAQRPAGGGVYLGVVPRNNNKGLHKNWGMATSLQWERIGI